MPTTAFQTRDNQLLAAMPPRDRERLQACLDLVVLVAGQVLHEAGQPARYAYFPIGAVVSLQVQSEDGDCDEVAVVGREGMVGVSMLTDCGACTMRSVVQSPGRALRLTARQFRAELEDSTAVLRLLLHYCGLQELQVAQGVVCSRHHTLSQRLALRLLVAVDRQQDKGPLTMTHEQIAGWLGVRRGSVSEEALKLQEAGLIAYKRGHITVLDRPGLEKRSCSCVSLVLPDSEARQRWLGVTPAPGEPLPLAMR
ncbi:MAG: Crp/Fnr family transcriptional regulator [Ramlibacter sp.]